MPPRIRNRFDVLVAGGGSAGCVLGARLSEGGRRVGLVEAGPDYGPFAVRGRENLTIVPGTLVDRVLLDGDRAVGVATAAGEIRAGVFVLAAGAHGSPGILLRSGIGPQRGLPVGEGLIDHVGVGFGYEGTERLQRETAAFERSHVVNSLTGRLCAGTRSRQDVRARNPDADRQARHRRAAAGAQ